MRLSEMQRFFDGFFQAAPRFVFRSMKDKPVVFRAIAGPHRDHFLVDPYNRRVSEIAEDELPPDPMIFETTALVLKHAMNKNMFSHVGISKRVAYRTRRANARHLNRLLTMLAAYEYEVLPLRKLFSFRTFRVYLRRWREVLVYVQILLALRRGVPMPEIEARLLGAKVPTTA